MTHIAWCVNIWPISFLLSPMTIRCLSAMESFTRNRGFPEFEHTTLNFQMSTARFYDSQNMIQNFNSDVKIHRNRVLQFDQYF